MKPIEYHPLEPFLPKNAKVLFLGSFPPPKNKWCIDFFYPNWINDHWRILGTVFFYDKEYFIDKGNRKFNKELITSFLETKGIAYYDTACAIRRLKDNASDAFLEVIKPTDIYSLLSQLPECQVIVTTGKKAFKTICEYFDKGRGLSLSEIESEVKIRLVCLPSSSRAYPLAFEEKVKAYRDFFEKIDF